MKYYIITYGCQMNESDSERIAAVLEKTGYKPAQKENEADLVVINMCSVRQSAVDRVFGQAEKFTKIKNIKPRLKTVLTGCILKQDRKKFAAKFDYILDIKKLNDWKNLLRRKKFPAKEKNYLSIIPKYASEQSVLIPVSNGCDNFCTYCAVPYTRGSLTCRNHKEIIKEIKKALKERPCCQESKIPGKTKEIWLLGQNVNDYRSPTDSSINFSKLLRMVNAIPGKFFIRLMSPNPKNFTNEMIDAMADCKKVAKFLNLPVQSGDDEILKKMNRPYSSKKYIELVRKIRKRIPDINLTTDVIVGFPGETKSQFENTAKLFRKIKFNLAYISKYSPRPGTISSKMKDNVSLKEKKRREKILRKIIEKKP